MTAMNSRRPVSFCIVALLCGLASSGCARSLPVELSIDDRQEIAASEFPHVVAVVDQISVRGQKRDLSLEVIALLKRTGLFADVAPLRSYGGNPDLVVTGEMRSSGRDIEGFAPLATLLTLGIIPDGISDTEIYSLTFAPAAGGRELKVEFVVLRKVLYGWFVLPLDLFSHYWFIDDEQRIADQLTLTLVKRTHEFQTLLDPSAKRRTLSDVAGKI